MFCILTVAIVLSVLSLVKTYQTPCLKWVQFIICKLHLKKGLYLFKEKNIKNININV